MRWRTRESACHGRLAGDGVEHMPVFGAAIGLAVCIFLVERRDFHSLEQSTYGLFVEEGLIRVVGPRVPVAEEVAGEPCAGAQARADQASDPSEVIGVDVRAGVPGVHQV